MRPRSKEHCRRISEARRGKTYEDLFGDRANEERRKRGSRTRGKTYEQIYGEDAQNQRNKRSIGNQGKTISEDQRRRCSEAMTGRTWTQEKKQERSAKFTGSRNPNWKGGISFEEYPSQFDENLREAIRTRDKNTCQLCGRTKEQEGRNLCVHHIDYDKDEAEPSNLISLCNSCHAQTNGSRLLWIGAFSLIRFMSSRKPDSFLFEGWIRSAEKIRRLNNVGFAILSEKENTNE